MPEAPVRPQEEFIELTFDAEDRVQVERPQKPNPKAARSGDGASKGKAKGKGKGKGKGKQRALLRVDDDEDEGSDKKKKEPKPKKHRMKESLEKFERPGLPEGGRFKGVTDRMLNAKLKKTRQKERESVLNLVKGEILHTAEAGYIEAEGREQTFKFKQSAISKEVTIGAAQKAFSFDLPYGPYSCAYTSNGQHMLAGGRKGQVALLHCDSMKILCELPLKETIRSVKALHNHTMFAVAQKKYAYIYDSSGVELHCIKDHKYPTHLDFLPYHYLLVSAGDMADLHYRDISTGQQVVRLRTHLGPCRSMRHNPQNAVVHLGHSNGTVTMWTPNHKEPVVKMFAHAGHVTGIAVHGNNMVTAGADGYWKVWDLRNYQSLHAFKCHGHAATDLDISMTGLVAVGFGSHLEIWRGAVGGGAERPRKPYLTEEYPGRSVTGVRFRPYEDVCGIGLSSGFANILVPGAGYANFDSFEANPFETKKQRREKEVRTLLEKLQPDTIMLDSSRIGNVDKAVVAKYQAEVDKQKKEEEAAAAKILKKKMRGANKAGARQKRKQLRLAKEQRAKTKERLEGEAANGAGSDDDDNDDDNEDDGPDSADDDESQAGADPDRAKKRAAGAALGRFYGKRRRKT